MPSYGTPQAGYNGPPDQGLNIRAVYPGDSYTLFDGTETGAEGLKSVSFARAMSPSSDDAGCSFFVSGMEATTEVDIQGANEDLDGSYTTLNTITADAGGNGSYTDVGRAQFYRAVLSTYGGGDDMPVVTVQR